MSRQHTTCLYSIFSVHTGYEIFCYEEYGHLQISAVSLFLLYLVKMIFSGLQIIYNTDVVVELLSPVQLFCDPMTCSLSDFTVHGT